MRATAATVLIAAVLAAAAPAAAVAQGSAGAVAGELPTTLFEPPPDGVPAGAPVEQGAGGAPILFAVALLAAAAAVGYFAGSSSRTSRS